jgi:membrane-associated phospholipid phosphatase
MLNPAESDRLDYSLRRRKARTYILLILWLGAGVSLIFWDSAIQPYLTSFGCHPVVRQIAEHWQELGATLGIVCFLIAGLLTIRRDRGQTFLRFALAISAAGIVVQLIKYLPGRARPNLVHDESLFYGPFGLLNHGPPIQIDSMPSGHTTAAFAMAFALAYRWRPLAPLWFLLAVGVGISRTLVDRHFPSDVVIGAWLGTVIGWGVCALSMKYPLKLEKPCAS